MEPDEFIPHLHTVLVGYSDKIDFNIVTYRGLRVTYKTGFLLHDWIYWHLIRSQPGTIGNTALSLIYTLQFTITHALWFSVFTSRILAKDLQQSHSNFKSYVKPSFHNLIHFLPLFCSYQFSSIPLLPTSYHGRLAPRNSRRLCSILL
jgi:hypothetical protein